MDGTQAPQNQDGSWKFEPGETVSPRQAPASVTGVSEPATPPSAIAPSPAQPQAATVPVPPVQAQPQIPAQPNYQPTEPTSDPSQDSIAWTASEFIAHHKSAGWYLALGVAALVAAALAWFFIDTVSSIFILFAAVIFGIYANHKPRELSYRIDETGITIGDKRYYYGQFRSFAIVPEGAFSSIVFVPLKRFAVLTTLYYDPDDEDRIVELLSLRLPIEDRRQDLIDRLMWRIRF